MSYFLAVLIISLFVALVGVAVLRVLLRSTGVSK